MAKLTGKKKAEFLARMKKGRAKAAKNPAKKTVAKKKAPAKRKTAIKKKAVAKKNPVKRSTSSLYIIRIENTKNQIGYLSDWLITRRPMGPIFDDQKSNAKTFTKNSADMLASAIVTLKTRGVRSVEVVKK